MVTLDITAQSVRQAREKGAQLIVSHHPVIFHPLKRLLSNSVPYLLAKEGIGAICAHTNLDMAPGGVSDCLAAALELSGRMEVAFTASFLAALWEPLPSLWSRKASRRL